MNRNLKYFIGGLTTVLAGFGIYKLLSSQRSPNTLPEEVWTTWNMPDLTGKVIIVTGANSGIGYEMSLAFAQKGARVIMACRSLEKGKLAMQDILSPFPDADLFLLQLDLSSLSSVKTFAENLLASHGAPDILINNAGVMNIPYLKTSEGFEMQFGVNHLGHFALTGLLLRYFDGVMEHTSKIKTCGVLVASIAMSIFTLGQRYKSPTSPPEPYWMKLMKTPHSKSTPN